MKKTATYKEAKKLAHKLHSLGISVQPETFNMRTSGIFIPRWLGYQNIPHVWHKDTKVCEWFFFLRMDATSDWALNVGEASGFLSMHGDKKLLHKINKKEKLF